MSELFLFLSRNWLDAMTRITLQGSIAIAAVLLITVLFRRISPTIKHLLWLLVIVKFLIMPFVLVPVKLPAQPLPPPRIISGPINEQTIPTPRPESVSSVPSNLPAAQASLPAETSKPKLTIPLPVILFSVWLLGLIFFILGICFRSLKYKKDIIGAKALEDKDFLNLVEEGAKEFRIKMPVVKVSEAFSCPLACGILKPTLIFPEHVITEFRREELKTVIYHELAHIKRKDILTNWLQIIVQAVYFFNPLIWYANRQMRLEREQACDDWVLQAGKADREVYNRALLKALELCSHGKGISLGIVGVSESFTMMTKRIRTIMDKGRKISTKISLKALLALVVVGLVVIPAYAITKKPVKGNLLALQENTSVVKENNAADSPFQTLSSIPPEKMQPGTIRIKVVSPDGDLVKKPRLFVRGYIDTPHSLRMREKHFSIMVETQAGEDGFISIPDLEPGLYWVILDKPKQPKWFLAKFIDLREDRQKDVILSRSDLLPNLNILVLDPDGKPYPKAEVDVKYLLFRPEGLASSWQPLGVFLSQGDGTVKVPQLSIGTYDFYATCNEWAPGGYRLTLTTEKAKEQIVLRLKRTRPISGRVIGPDGKPVAGCQVVVPVTYEKGEQRGSMGNYVGQKNIPAWAKRTTDNQGHFEFRSLSNDSAYGFYAWHPETGIGFIEDVSPGDTEIVIQIQSGRNLRGRILDPVTRKPIPGLTITANGTTGVFSNLLPPIPTKDIVRWPWWVGFSKTETDNKGNFEFKNICPGVTRLTWFGFKWDSPDNPYIFSLPLGKIENIGDIIGAKEVNTDGKPMAEPQRLVDNAAWQAILFQFSSKQPLDIYDACAQVQAMGKNAIPKLIDSAFDNRPAKYFASRNGGSNVFLPGTYYTLRNDVNQPTWGVGSQNVSFWTVGDLCLGIACDLVHYPSIYAGPFGTDQSQKGHEAFRNYTYRTLKEWYEKHKNDKTAAPTMNSEEFNQILHEWRRLESQMTSKSEEVSPKPAENNNLRPSTVKNSEDTGVLTDNDEILAAAFKGDVEKIKTLLAKNPVLVNARDKGGATPLHLAVIGGNKDVVEMLLAHKADANSRTSTGWTPLHNAALFDKKEIIGILLSHGADVDARDNTGASALIVAAKKNYKGVAEILLRGLPNGNSPSRKANVGVKDAWGNTPLHWVARTGGEDVAETLFSYNADANDRDDVEFTPLHYAAINGKKDVAEVLLSHNADVNAKNILGQTPLFYAKREGHKDMVELLLSHKAVDK